MVRVNNLANFGMIEWSEILFDQLVVYIMIINKGVFVHIDESVQIS